jgi:hypothetical protein
LERVVRHNGSVALIRNDGEIRAPLTPQITKLAADDAIAFFSSNLFQLRLNVDRAPQLKAGVRLLSFWNGVKFRRLKCGR